MLRYLTGGESHGESLTVIIDGIPAGVKIEVERINEMLAARQMGVGRGERMKIEKDVAKVSSGIRFGITLGSPITITINNRDWENWQKIMTPFGEIFCDASPRTVPRPGHADFAGAIKYGHTDLRNVLERASARETAARVCVGAICKILLSEFGVEVLSYVIQIGNISTSLKPSNPFQIKKSHRNSLLRCIDPEIEPQMIKTIESARDEGDTLGGRFEIMAFNLPIGLGSYTQYDRRLDGRLAQSLMSIPAIKGVEIGLGFGVVDYKGSQVHDEIFYDTQRGFYRKTNHAGGLEGGVTNGEPLLIRAAMKPIPTVKKPLHSVDIITKESAIPSYERSDVCAVPAASIVGEAMIAIELFKAMQEKYGGDTLQEMKNNKGLNI